MDLDTKLQSSEAQASVWKMKVEDQDRAEMEVGKMAVEMEGLQTQLLDVLHERDDLLVEVQRLREDLSEKERALRELELTHARFMGDYEKMQYLLTDIQHSLSQKEKEHSDVSEQKQVVIVA